MENKSIKIQIKGLVQGVGFRPFIYRIAKENELNGWVENRTDGVQIQVQGDSQKIEQFILSIKQSAPVASHIESVIVEELLLPDGTYTVFQIHHSKDNTEEITEISPDIAVCPDCMNDMQAHANRFNYSFINCTNCGPRFSIIKDLPYDREKTTMKKFVMCDDCKKEYLDVTNRYFHAQPVACNHCGPKYELLYDNQNIKQIDIILNAITNLIDNGKIVSIKGLGGFHIACDATNERAVQQLRKLKHREGNPFAVLFSDIQQVKKYAVVNNEEEKSLLSWKRPILLLKTKTSLAEGISIGLGKVGVMLPYMPFHYQLFEELKTPAIVLTSGNISDEPIVIENAPAIKKLLPISDALLIHNRDIFNRVDDSVVMVVNKKERIIRRSRSYAPSPIRLKMNVDGIIATGAELKNCFCVGKGTQAILSQHIGDLKNLETLEFFEETIEKYQHVFRIKPQLIACDLHPEYLSTKYAEQQVELEKIQVQHHHAHIASCMAEHHLDEKVIGVSFDGVGYGDDGNIWGGEFLICDLNDYERFTHFDYIPMPGGDKASKEPWRMGISYLYKVYGNDFPKHHLPFLKNINNESLELLLFAIDNKINSPLISSAGRLFDAVAAIAGLCNYATFEAEAPMRLEAMIDEKCNEKYSYQIEKTILVENTIREVVEDVKRNIPTSIIAAKFHNTIISIIFEAINDIKEKYNVNKIVLSGGTFQNSYLLENIENLLNNNKYKVYTHSKIPANDGGIALGQLAITAKRRELGNIPSLYTEKSDLNK